MTLTPNVPVAADLLADFKVFRGVTAHVPGLTIAGGFLQWAAFPTADITLDITETHLGIIADDAATAGDVPNPADQGRGTHSDWSWWQVAHHTPPARAAIFDGSTSPMIRWRAQRRFDEVGTRLWIVLHADVETMVAYNVSTLLLT